MMTHDAVQPAPGVRVLGVPRERVHISQAQQKAARRPETDHKGNLKGVYKPVMQGGAVTLGCMSAARELQKASNIKATRSRIPGTRRRGHCHAPMNTGFAGAIPGARAYQDRENMAFGERVRQELATKYEDGKAELRMLLRTHCAQMKRFGSVTEFYLLLRSNVLKLYPWLVQEIQRIESAHRRTLLSH